MTTSSVPGASAWRRPPWYSVDTCGGRLNAVDDADGKRIRLAAGAIQEELELQGYLGPGAHDGHYGPKTDAAIKAFQRQHGLVVDGAAGPKTLLRLCYPVIYFFQAIARPRIPDNLLLGLLRLESGVDPGAQGVDRTRSTDRGLGQISDVSFPHITDAQAYGDIRFSIAFGAGQLIGAKRRQTDAQTFADMGAWDCAIANHNNPSKADAWFDTGSPPDHQISEYVRLVRVYAAKPI